MSELIDPTTGEILDTSDADQLIEAYMRIEDRDREIFAAKCEIRRAIGALTTGDAKTRRVRGRRFRCKVTMPDERLDQSKLKEAWNSYPQFAPDVLRIAAIELRKREWAKVENESGPPDFMTFKSIVESAIQPPTGLPRIEVELADSQEPAEQASARESAEELI